MLHYDVWQNAEGFDYLENSIRSIGKNKVLVQYRTLPFGFLHCMGRPKPACHLLILLGVTPVYKGLTPSGKMHPP